MRARWCASINCRWAWPISKKFFPKCLDLILIPKVESPDEVREVDAVITAICERTGWTRDIWIMPIVESALGVENAYAIAKASDRNAAITIGLEDYTADLGVTKTTAGAVREAIRGQPLAEGLGHRYSFRLMVTAASARGMMENT